MSSRVIPNDYVSRYELVKHLVGVHDGWRHPFGYTVEDEIINFPAADVAPVRHGSWHKYSKGSGSYNGVIILSDAFQCTICKKSFWNKSDYCPNCGAKMDGGQDDA